MAPSCRYPPLVVAIDVDELAVPSTDERPSLPRAERDCRRLGRWFEPPHARLGYSIDRPPPRAT